jgi:hypothetical protein
LRNLLGYAAAHLRQNFPVIPEAAQRISGIQKARQTKALRFLVCASPIWTGAVRSRRSEKIRPRQSGGTPAGRNLVPDDLFAPPPARRSHRLPAPDLAADLLSAGGADALGARPNPAPCRSF